MESQGILSQDIKPQHAKAIMLKAEGATYPEIKKQTGVPKRTIARLTSKHKIFIQKVQADLVEKTLIDIEHRTVTEIQAGKKLTDYLLLSEDEEGSLRQSTNPTRFDDPKDMNTFLARLDKKEEGILKSVGILPSHAPSVHIQTILNDNRQTVLAPIVGALLKSKGAELEFNPPDEDITDAEFTEEDDT